MVIFSFFLGIGRADLLFIRRYASDLLRREQDGHGHALLFLRSRRPDPPFFESPPQLSTEEWTKMTMVILLSFLGLEGHSSPLSRRSAMINYSSLYWGKGEDDHGHHTPLLRTRRADLLFSRS